LQSVRASKLIMDARVKPAYDNVDRLRVAPGCTPHLQVALHSNEFNAGAFDLRLPTQTCAVSVRPAADRGGKK
jgi:hypothetical protein